MRKKLRIGLVVLVTALVVGVPGDAQAQLNPCGASAPAPRRPDTGMPGWFATTPADPPQSRGPATPPEDLFDTYGTAGLWWPTWDLGCSGSAEGVVTDMANVAMDWASAALNGTASLRGLAWDDSWLTPLDDTVAALTDRLGTFYRVAMGLALAAVGVWMLFRARTAQYGEIATSAAWAVLMMALGAVALSYPSWAGRTFDEMAVGSAEMVNDTLAGESDRTPDADPTVAQINADVAYRVWLRGMFGSDTTRTAEVFGPRFYDAMAFAWSELPTLDRGGPEAAALVERHRDAFVAAARELEQADPAAYRTMQGKGAFSTRVPTGMLGWVLVTSLCFLAGVAAGLVLVARLIGRGLIMALPVVIPFGTLYRWSGPVRKLAGIAQAVVVALITATIAGGLLTRAVGALLSTDWPLWLVGLVTLVASYVTWKAIKPLGTVAGMVGLSGAARLPGHALGAVAALVGARVGAKSGVEDDDNEESGSSAVIRAEEYSAHPPQSGEAKEALPSAEAFGALPEAAGPEPSSNSSTADFAPRALPAPADDGGGPSEPHPAGEPEDGHVLDTHLVVGADGQEVYEVYQRAEVASR
jgi:hypothetical protein